MHVKNHGLRIDAWFDLICPWCLIGQRQLELALADWRVSSPDIPLTVQWHPTQLLPQIPPEGLPFQAFYEQRLGSLAAVRARQAQVREVAESVGVDIDFSRIHTFPNTARAHALLLQASQQLGPSAHDALLKRLFSAYFQEGCNLGNLSTLQNIAAEFSMDAAALAHALQTAQNLPITNIPGVPYFVFNHRVALSGAQPPEVLLAAMRESMSAAP